MTNPLFDAVRSGDRERVKHILKSDPDSVRARDAGGATPLHHAAERGDREIANLLIDAGADINARDGKFGATPAGWAIEYLRERGALLGMEIEDVNYAVENGDTALVGRYVTRLPALANFVPPHPTTAKERRPIACDMSALSAAERERYTALRNKLLAAIRNVASTATAFRLTLNDSISVTDAAEWMTLERRCCPFLDLGIELDRQGSMRVTIGGDENIMAFLAEEFRF